MRRMVGITVKKKNMKKWNCKRIPLCTCKSMYNRDGLIESDMRTKLGNCNKKDS